MTIFQAEHFSPEEIEGLQFIKFSEYQKFFNDFGACCKENGFCGFKWSKKLILIVQELQIREKLEKFCNINCSKSFSTKAHQINTTRKMVDMNILISIFSSGKFVLGQILCKF